MKDEGLIYLEKGQEEYYYIHIKNSNDKIL
jgi:hypothetical protein